MHYENVTVRASYPEILDGVIKLTWINGSVKLFDEETDVRRIGRIGSALRIIRDEIDPHLVLARSRMDSAKFATLGVHEPCQAAFVHQERPSRSGNKVHCRETGFMRVQVNGMLIVFACSSWAGFIANS